MKNFLFILFFVTPITLLAQSEEMQEIDKKILTLTTQLEGAKKFTEDQRKRLEEERKRLVEKSELYSGMDTYLKHYDANKIKAQEDIEAAIKELSLFQRFGDKANFYKCMRNSFRDYGKMGYDMCRNIHRPELTAEENERAEGWKKMAGISKDEALQAMQRLPNEIKLSLNTISMMESNLEYSVRREQGFQNNIKAAESTKAELSTLPKYEKFTNCDSSTPEINLEEKIPYEGADFQGPFFGIPRDNQDGLGTCFANTAKNLLIGLSGGKDNASFTDLALAFKGNTGALIANGIEGGESCSTLEEARKIGYCPQELSPLENGERNIVGEALFNKGPYDYLSTNVHLLKYFIQDMEGLKKSDNPLKDTILKDARPVIEKLKNNPDIIIPLPVARYNIPPAWKLRETYTHFVKKNSNASESDFLEDYDNAYKKFYPAYVEAILAGKKGEDIFKVFRASMEEFLKKYNLESKLPEWEKAYISSAEKDLTDPEIGKKLRASLDFLKDLMNQKSTSDLDFMKECLKTPDILKFLTSMKPLIEKMRDDKLNEELLLDKDGKFKNARDLMQLTVAPACINKENRKPLPDFSCHAGYDTVNKIKGSGKDWNAQKKMFREKVVLSLAKGYPLGNSFLFTPPDGHHINTIVGMRFNPETKTCEIRIRESQTGTSNWHSEDVIFSKINALTEVRNLK